MFASSRESLVARIRLFSRDGRGVAALEFALVVPLLLMLYFVTMEVAQAIEANKKVGRVGNMVADLVTQQQQMSKNELEGIMRLGESTLQPYNRSAPDIEITAIEVTDETTPKVQVVWARKLVNGSFLAGSAKGTPVTIPPALRIKGSFLIRVEGKLDYRPVITWAASAKETLGLMSAFDNIPMTETYYLRPRMSMTIPCTDCY